MGHFNGASVLAEEFLLQAPENVVTIVSDDDFFGIIRNKRILFKKIQSRKSSGGDGLCLREDYGKDLSPLFAMMQPDLIVFETFFPKDVLREIDVKKTKVVLLVKRYDKKNFQIFLQNKYYKYFDSVLLLRDVDCDNEKIVLALNAIIGKKIFVFFGSLIKKLNKENIATLRKKYGITRNKFVVLATFGGGGYVCSSGRTESELMAPVFAVAANNLVKKNKKLKFILLGGYFSMLKENMFDGVLIRRHEIFFSELLSIVDLVICQGGPNISNELLYFSVPSLIFPVSRGDDKQLNRAMKMEKIGGAVRIKDFTSEYLENEIAYLYKNEKKINAMKQCTLKIKKESGNAEIVRFLLDKKI